MDELNALLEKSFTNTVTEVKEEAKKVIRRSIDVTDNEALQMVKVCYNLTDDQFADTLAELSVINIPFIAVPLPSSKDNHQFENANFYKDNDCCWIIEQNSFEEKIEDFLEDILNNKNDYLKKRENLKKLNYQNTWINVNQKILKAINEN